MSAVSRLFFGTGLTFLVGGALLHLGGLVGLTGGEALVHLPLLGWITAMIFAVAYHTLPVFTARGFPYSRLNMAHWSSFTAGVFLVTAGMLMAAQFLILLGYGLELTSALLFLANTVLLFRNRPRQAVQIPLPPPHVQSTLERIGARATQWAALCLPLALALLLAVQSGWLNGKWHLAAEHLLTLGWMMFMIIGVSYHVLPRFSQRPLRGVRWARGQVALHQVALVIIVVGLGQGWTTLFTVGAAAMGLSLTLFAWTVAPTLYALRLPVPAMSTVSVGVRHE